MIFGCFSFGASDSAVSVGKFAEGWSNMPGISCHTVSSGRFTGLYLLNNRLPLSERDIVFADEASDLLVIGSGAIYNSREICAKHDIPFTEAMPELAGRLFLDEGPGFAGCLNGDFTIFICRPQKGEGYLFRDHVGISPAAYILSGNSFYFSTDIPGLCFSFPHAQPIDDEYLTSCFRFTDRRKSPCPIVKKLPGGHYLEVSEGMARQVSYWFPGDIKTDNTLSIEDISEGIRELLGDAVAIRSDRRYKAGAHVSGGLDSAVVSVLAREQYRSQDDFYGFSWSPASYDASGVKYDERTLAVSLCNSAGISPVFQSMDARGFLGQVSDFRNNQGFFSESVTLRQAHERGVNLLFSGWGGDEFVSTGGQGVDIDLLRHLKVSAWLRRYRGVGIGRMLKNLIYFVMFPVLGILGGGTVATLKSHSRYLKPRFRKQHRQSLRNFYFYTSRRQMHLRLLEFYHLQERCEAWTVMGFRNGVEYRYPLLDKRIIEYMLKVPSEKLAAMEQYRPLMKAAGEGLLPDDLTKQWHKNDPVYWRWMEGLQQEAAGRLEAEVSEWRRNKALHFVDFSRLEGDLERINGYICSSERKSLCRAMVYIKGVHEFTAAGGGLHEDQV